MQTPYTPSVESDTVVAGSNDAPGVIAFIAGTYPLPSETFVYREVGALRDQGWMVQTVSLHASPDDPAEITGRDEPAPMGVYDDQAGRTLRAAVAELVTYPWRSSGTLLTAVGDALVPGEAMALMERLKLPVQAIFGIGLARRLREQAVAHIHCHFAHAPTSVGMYAARQLGVPLSFTGHANDIFQRRALLRRKLERAVFVSCISEWHRTFYRRICDRESDVFPIVRCGVAVDQWQPTASTQPRSTEAMHVMTVCRLVEKKGVDTLIRAMAQLLQSAPDGWRLTIVGDGPMREALTTLARELGCDQAIRWEGAVNNQRVRALLADADVFALPCRTDRHDDRDGIPVSLMEAMACGLPVVAGDLEAIRELVEHERTGLLVDGVGEQAVDAVAQALAWLAESNALRRQLGEAGAQRVCEEFSQSVNIDRLMTAIRRAAASPAA